MFVSTAGPNLAPTLLGNPQFTTVSLAATSPLANCRPPNVPMASAATTTACAYPVHGLDSYMNGQSASLPCSGQGNGSAATDSMHAPPHYNYGAGAVAGSTVGGNHAHEEQVNGAQPQDGRLRPIAASSQQQNGGSFNGHGASIYSAVPIGTRCALDLPASSLLSLPLSMTLAPVHQRVPQSNGHQPQSNGDSGSPSSPVQPPPTNGHAQHHLPATWTMNGAALLSQVPQVGYGAEWHQMGGGKPSTEQDTSISGGSSNATESDGGFYDGSPGSLYRYQFMLELARN